MKEDFAPSQRSHPLLRIVRLFFIVALAGGISAFYMFGTERNSELWRARKWASGLDTNKESGDFNSIAIVLEGHTFGISTHIKSQSHGGWTFDGERKAKKYFAYPPGIEVGTIAEAFELFDAELARMIDEKVQNQQSPNESTAEDGP